MTSLFSPLAIIDLGSNTTKLSVISLPDLRRLAHSARYTRIGRGMKTGSNQLSEASINDCVQAILELIEEAEAHHPVHYELVATSAVREAQNRQTLIDRVHAETGLHIRVLSGLQEAELIGKGVATDSILSDLGGAFTLFDLGGGSLECIDYFGGSARQLASLPLGAVRMTERYISDPKSAIPLHELDAIYEATQESLRSSEFDFSCTTPHFIGAGGAFVVARSLFGAHKGQNSKRTSPIIEVKALGNLFSNMIGLDLKQRCEIPGMDVQRADIMPAALSVLLAVSEFVGIKNFTHSYHNLPFGVVAEYYEKVKLLN